VKVAGHRTLDNKTSVQPNRVGWEGVRWIKNVDVLRQNCTVPQYESCTKGHGVSEPRWVGALKQALTALLCCCERLQLATTAVFETSLHADKLRPCGLPLALSA